MPMVNANGVDIHYRDVGEGFPIVLIHGYTGNSWNWELTVRALVLVDTAAEVPKGLLYEERRKQRQKLVEIAKNEGMEAVFEEQLKVTPIPEAFTANREYIDVWRQQFLMTSREAYIACANG